VQNTTIEGTLNFNPGVGASINYAGNVLNNNAMNVQSGTVTMPGIVTSTAPTGALDYAPEVLADGPVLYYRFEEASGGGPAADSSGNAHNGTYLHNATPGQPSFNPALGNAVDFDGADDSVEINHTISSQKMSVETWFFADVITGWRCILNHDQWTTSYVHYQFNGNPLRWSINGNGGDTLFSDFTFNAGEWYHVVTTYDGSTTTGNVNLYVNGVLVQTADKPNTQIPQITPGNIGAWNENEREWDGRMDEFAIYDAVLTPTQVQHHYDVALGGGVKGGINVSAGAKLLVGGFQGLNYVNLDGDLTTTGAITSHTRDLTMAAGTTLDLQQGNLVVDYEDGAPSPFDDIVTKVAEGYNAAAGIGNFWTGTGITSSAAAGHTQSLTALGVLDNSDPDIKLGGLTSLEGLPVDLSSVLVKYTWYGDANLDGVVDSNDYDMIDNAWLLWTTQETIPEGGFRWGVGDFNYDGVIDSNDYDKIDNAFMLQGAPLGGVTTGGSVPTPEPASLLLLGLGAAVALARKRRSR
jgi:hypothetical protein